MKETKVENYFNSEINLRKLCNKKLSKYVAAFNYIDKILIVLCSPILGVYIISSVSAVGAPVEITGASFFFSLTTGVIKKLFSITRNKKKKYDQVLMLGKSKLNSIENLISQALIDMEISLEEFNAIVKMKNKYEKMKENLRNVNKKLEKINKVMRLNGVISRA